MTTPLTNTCYTIAPYRGKPTLFIDGVPSPCVMFNQTHDVSFAGSEEIHRKFAASGYDWYMLTTRGGAEGDYYTTDFWLDQDVFPEVTGAVAVANSLNRQAEMTLKYAPEARFWVRFNATPPRRWRERYPDHLLLNTLGQQFEDPSPASAVFLEQQDRFIENLVRYCERMPWGENVAGYVCYPMGEGTTQLSVYGFLFDYSPVMQAGFKDYLRRRYRTDAALQAAWQRADVTLATAAVPDEADFKQRGKTDYTQFKPFDITIERIAHRLHWPEPEETAAERDYCLYMRELTATSFSAMTAVIKRVAPNKLAGIDAFKQTMLGWPQHGLWAGDFQSISSVMHVVSGAFGMAELLDDPNLDVVATPHDYTKRGMGFGYEGEGIGDAVVAHGKLMLMEEDARTFSQPDLWRWDALKDMDEVRAGLWRNLGVCLTRGYNTYPMDVCGPSFFMDDGIQAVMAARREVQEASLHWQRREVPSLVMVVDDWSVLDEDFTNNYQELAILNQRLYGLSRCGVPFRLHLLEDLARDDFPTCHKVFYFPNLFRVTPERLALLREKVFRAGNVAIFGPASGLTDGATISATSAMALTGIPLELQRKEMFRRVTVNRFDHPLTRRLATCVDYGDSLVYGPLLIPQAHPEVTVLGSMRWPGAMEGAGLVVREFGRGAAGNGTPGARGAGDYAAIFSAAVPLPAALLRECARFSGTHVYGEADDLIFADACTLTVHAVYPGPRTIALPHPSTVWNLISREKVGEQLTELQLNIRPPQTDLFYLGENDPFWVR